MALKARVTTLDGLPDGVADHYTESKGADGNPVYVLNVTPDGDFGLGDMGKLQRTIVTTRNERDEYKKLLQPFRDDSGELLDPETARSALAAVAELGDDPDVKEKNKKALEQAEQQLAAKFDAQRSQLIEKHKGEQEATAKTISSMRSQLEQALITQEAALAVSKHNGIGKLLMPVIKSSVRMAQDEDGNFRVEVLDTNGQPRLSQRPNSGTELMAIDEYVETLRNDSDFGSAFKADSASGGGSVSADRNNKAGGVLKISQDQASDAQKYRAAKAQAEKAGQTLEVVAD